MFNDFGFLAHLNLVDFSFHFYLLIWGLLCVVCGGGLSQRKN